MEKLLDKKDGRIELDKLLKKENGSEIVKVMM
jgi:hypothetical protein